MDPEALVAQGEQLMRSGRYGEAQAFFERAADAFGGRQNVLEQLRCRLYVGRMLGAQGRDGEAAAWLTRAADEAEKLDDPLTRCNAFSSLGNVLSVQGRDKESAQWLKAAADEAEKLDDPLTRSIAFRSLGDVLRVLGGYGEAAKWLKRAADEAEKLDDPLTRCNAFNSLGNVLRVQGRYGEAAKSLKRAADEAEKLDDPLTRCNAFSSLGNVLAAQRRYDEAAKCLTGAADEAQKLDDPLTRCVAFSSLGDVLRLQGRDGEAAEWLTRAAAEAEKLNAPVMRCNAFVSLGNLLRAQRRDGEAAEWLTRAAAEADKLEQPLMRCNVAASLGDLAAAEQRWNESRHQLSRAQDHLLELLGSNRAAEAVGNVMGTYGYLFEVGVRACEASWRAGAAPAPAAQSAGTAELSTGLAQAEGPQTGAPDPLWQGLAFVDGAKCVAIREGLRRQGRKAATSAAGESWQAAPADWRDVFLPRTSVWSFLAWLLGTRWASRGAQTPEGARVRAVRGMRGMTAGPESAAPAVESPFLELPGESDPIKGQFCRPIGKDGVARLLPDQDTVLVTFYWQRDDLIVLPIRRDSAGEPVLLTTPEGYFRAPGILPEVRALAEKHGAAIKTIAFQHVGLPAAELNRMLGPIAQLYEQLYRLLRLDALLELIEPTVLKRSQLHLVLIPDGPLYGLSLHAAARSATGPRLYQEVASARYGLSLRTLELQQDIQDTRAAQEANDRILRGVAFANPDRKKKILDGVTVREPKAKFLEGVIREVQALVVEGGAGAWWIHGEKPPESQQAVRLNLHGRHTAGNLGWFVGHGDEFEADVTAAQGATVRSTQPGVQLLDGPVVLSDLFSGGYDFSRWLLANFSCCLLGQLRILGTSHEVLGYIAALTLLGCRRMSSALWWLSDASAPVFAQFWIRAIKQHVFGPTPPGPHAFAVAFKEALDAFRAFYNGYYDHEFYWAPYTLYGLG
jgi:tetratricopeptide (TPR) repeat protein